MAAWIYYIYILIRLRLIKRIHGASYNCMLARQEINRLHEMTLQGQKADPDVASAPLFTFNDHHCKYGSTAFSPPLLSSACFMGLEL